MERFSFFQINPQILDAHSGYRDHTIVIMTLDQHTSSQLSNHL